MALASLIAGGYHHLANERTDILAGFPVALRRGQRFCETDHLGAIMFGDIRATARPRCRSCLSSARSHQSPKKSQLLSILTLLNLDE